MILALLVLLVGCGQEEVKNYYLSLDAAKQGKAVERGLIPAVFPTSAKNIKERHFIDIDRVWIKFEMDVKEIPVFLTKLESIDNSKINVILSEITGTPNWWPKELKKKPNDINNNFKFAVAKYKYSVTYGDKNEKHEYGYFFMNSSDGSAYYYGGCSEK